MFTSGRFKHRSLRFSPVVISNYLHRVKWIRWIILYVFSVKLLDWPSDNNKSIFQIGIKRERNGRLTWHVINMFRKRFTQREFRIFDTFHWKTDIGSTLSTQKRFNSFQAWTLLRKDYALMKFPSKYLSDVISTLYLWFDMPIGPQNTTVFHSHSRDFL